MTRLSVYPPTPCKLAGAASVSGSSHRERDDTYGKVIVQLGPRWRVITCKDGLQWILQRRSVAPPNTGTWAGNSYSTTRDALIAACSDRELLSEPAAGQVLEALPSDVRTFIAERSRS